MQILGMKGFGPVYLYQLTVIITIGKWTTAVIQWSNLISLSEYKVIRSIF